MARREVGEINAGSMADIAFLLLIFFLVTTTMEVDAGISRQLPIKLDNPPEQDIEINMRNVLEIMANSNDNLLVENKFIDVEDLQEIVMDFYTVNISQPDTDLDMPNYQTVNEAQCLTKVAEYTTKSEENPDDKILQSELNKWKTKLELCQALPTKQYKEINKQAVIQLKNQSGTSYGLYIEIHNIIQRVVNELRVAKCDEMGWGNYLN